MKIDYKIKETKELPDAEVEIIVEIPWKNLEAERAQALKEITKTIEIQGFRKGFAPEKLVIERVGEMAILEQAAEHVINHTIAEVIEEKKLNTIGRPAILITKLAPGSEFEYKITVALVPKAELPDYKKIAKEINKKEDDLTLTDKEVDDYIEEIRRGYARHTHSYKEDHSHDEHNDEDLVLPELNEEFIKKVGQFKDLEDFKVKIREHLKNEKEAKAQQKKRIDIVESVIKDTKVVVPKVLIDSELEKILGQFKDDVTKMGVKIDDYLAHIKKTEDDMRAEWKDEAEKRAKMNIILAEIALAEKIKADESQIEEQTKHLMTQYKDADTTRARMYVEYALTNEAVFKFLEEQK